MVSIVKVLRCTCSGLGASELSIRYTATGTTIICETQVSFLYLGLSLLSAHCHRHWAIFNSGTAVLLTFWLLTPLQPAIFNTGTVIRKVPVQMATTARLANVTEQVTGMAGNVLNTAYGITWLNQTLPPYTTREYATLPFRPMTMAKEALESETWTAVTNVYRTNLTCKAANMTFRQADAGPVRPKGQRMFDNGEGCLAQDVNLLSFAKDSRFDIQYMIM